MQARALELVRLALRALDAMRGLDESLYERFVADRERPGDPAAAAESFRQLWAQTFRDLDPLVAWCRFLDRERLATGSGSAPAIDDDAFDLGELELGEPAAGSSDELELGLDDIGTLIEGLDAHVATPASDTDRWGRVVEAVGSIEYGLSSMLADASSRLAVALDAGDTRQVLALLDDTQGSANEGVRALVTAVYEAFLPQVDPATIVPGYMTALDRALLVRRGLAQLSEALAPPHAALQADDPSGHAAALDAIRRRMAAFVGSMVCRAMRPADRWQIVEFERALASAPLGGARLTVEDLVTYLQSLRSINQREVLVTHDQRVLDALRDAVANARQLVELSPPVAHDIVARACADAQRLRGRRPMVDSLLAELERDAAGRSTPELIAVLDQVLARSGA